MKNTSSHAMSPLEWAMLLILSLVWGGSFFLAAVAVKEVPPMTIACVRVGLAAVVLLVVLRIIGVAMPRNRTIWLAFFGMGLLNNVVPFSLIFWAQTELASGVASILNAMTPIFTAIAAHFLTSDEKMSGGRMIGVVLGFVGVFVLMGAPDGGSFLAHVAVLTAAVSYAFASIFGKRFRAMGVAPLATATGQVSASALILLPIVLVVDQPWALAMPSGGAIAALVALALLSTSFAYFLYFRILSTAGATNLALVTFLIPPSAIMLGVLALDEVLLLRQILGMAIIGAGLAAIDGRVFRAFGR